MSNVLMVLRTTVIKISLFFSFYRKNEKGISDCFVTQCSHVLFYVILRM